MFYIHYDEDGNIQSAANTTDAELWIEIPEELYHDFSLSRKLFHDYKVVEDIQVKGKMYVTSITYNDLDGGNHNTGIIQCTRTTPLGGIQIVQNKQSWTVNSFIDNETRTELAYSQDYFKEYYIVDATNRFILFDKFTINLKDFIHSNSIKIQGCSANTYASVVTRSSHLLHTHKTGTVK
jgi:hypothetical protein|tara:strand:- start:1177 stop:1716 length:540 start_codon:yes stop_codon:yes gene_type:complete